ncbi:type II toxin-antitoxin system VapB family antitoxin [Micromonospora sp. WMMC415]|uniref:type II toxin-antitoxin system VapB family antitoxin n=1 Tax=Micromonospora sp. WMMC415 TaxID=2675222 RepID=UPI001E573134|nr:type II toxin-antitoxin system VapB family antitoxin [Micromonospora sp. WMMC415]
MVTDPVASTEATDQARDSLRKNGGVLDVIEPTADRKVRTVSRTILEIDDDLLAVAAKILGTTTKRRLSTPLSRPWSAGRSDASSPPGSRRAAFPT